MRPPQSALLDARRTPRPHLQKPPAAPTRSFIGSQLQTRKPPAAQSSQTPQNAPGTRQQASGRCVADHLLSSDLPSPSAENGKRADTKLRALATLEGARTRTIWSRSTWRWRGRRAGGDSSSGAMAGLAPGLSGAPVRAGPGPGVSHARWVRAQAPGRGLWARETSERVLKLLPSRRHSGGLVPAGWGRGGLARYPRPGPPGPRFSPLVGLETRQRLI
jgi:hypothetical protein